MMSSSRPRSAGFFPPSPKIEPTALRVLEEIAKLALVTYLAYSLGRKADRVKTFTIGFVPHLIVCGMMMALLLKQPDLGSSVVLGAGKNAVRFAPPLVLSKAQADSVLAAFDLAVAEVAQAHAVRA